MNTNTVSQRNAVTTHLEPQVPPIGQARRRQSLPRWLLQTTLSARNRNVRFGSEANVALALKRTFYG